MTLPDRWARGPVRVTIRQAREPRDKAVQFAVVDEVDDGDFTIIAIASPNPHDKRRVLVMFLTVPTDWLDDSSESVPLLIPASYSLSAPQARVAPASNHNMFRVEKVPTPEDEGEARIVASWLAQCRGMYARHYSPGIVQRKITPFAEAWAAAQAAAQPVRGLDPDTDPPPPGAA